MDSKRSKAVKEAIARFNEEMRREPGAKERCREYLQKLGRECGYYYDDQGNIHYEKI